jgi:hypothetical protein
VIRYRTRPGRFIGGFYVYDASYQGEISQL